MKYPLAVLCIAFCLGIITSAYSKIPFPVLYALAFLCLIFSIIFIKQSRKSSFFLLCAVCCLGAALLANSRILPDCHIAKAVPYKSDSLYLIGTIDSDPVYQNGRSSFVLKTEKITIHEAWQKACGRILVRVSQKDNFTYGNRLLLNGKLYRPFSFSKSEFNYRGYLERQGIHFILSVRKGGRVKKLEPSAGNPLKSFSLGIKHRLRKVIISNLSSFSAGIMNALILGDREDLPPYLLEILMKLGTIHIIAISGFNVGIVAFIILLSLKIIKIPRKPRYLLAVTLLVIYCVLTGSSAPVVRATIMATIFLGACFFGRQGDICNSLAIATFVILGANPWQLFEISFQLSFLSVASIIWLAPKIEAVFPVKFQKKPGIRFLISTFSVSCAAWIGLMPLIAYYFRTFTPITVLANMIIVPYSAIITASGFSFTLIDTCIPFLTSIFAASNELLILILFKIHLFLFAIPGAYFKLPAVPFLYVSLYYILLIVSIGLPKTPRQ